MEHFTWIPIYREIAQKLRDYENRQHELIDLTRDMKNKGLKTISLTEKHAGDLNSKEAEIDPFTFFANFNMPTKEVNRKEIIRFLKSRWQLNYDVPDDFAGLPTITPLNAWMANYKNVRNANDIPLLWTIFNQALDDNVQEETFNAALKISGVKYNLTMGLFWIAPEHFLNLDGVSREYLSENKIPLDKPLNYHNYQSCMQTARNKFGKTFYEISYDAWIWKNGGDTPPKTTYWLCAPGEGGKYWEEFHKEGIIGIGWDELGDLTQYKSKQEVASALKKHWGREQGKKAIDALACYGFCRDIQVGDHIFAKSGTQKILGWGIVTSDYIYDGQRSENKHIRKVDWKAKGEWTTADDIKLPVKTLTNITKKESLVNYLEKLVGPEPPKTKYTKEQFLEETGITPEMLERWQTALEHKRQAVFYGPPGTGKTYIAERFSRYLTSSSDGFYEVLQFHPAYSYEDFMEGLRPEADAQGNLQFNRQEGRFLEFCSKARKCAGNCVLIIDELNRANLARVFGELMYLLEYRDMEIPLAGGNRFKIPDNVLIIGTMNTADRSIALVDFALRRRFAFFELAPDYKLLKNWQGKRGFNATGLIKVLQEINTDIENKHFHLGISFFMVENLKEHLENIWRLEIESYLEEYFFSQPEKLQQYQWEKIGEQALHGLANQTEGV